MPLFTRDELQTLCMALTELYALRDHAPDRNVADLVALLHLRKKVLHLHSLQTLEYAQEIGLHNDIVQQLARQALGTGHALACHTGAVEVITDSDYPPIDEEYQQCLQGIRRQPIEGTRQVFIIEGKQLELDKHYRVHMPGAELHNAMVMVYNVYPTSRRACVRPIRPDGYVTAYNEMIPLSALVIP